MLFTKFLCPASLVSLKCHAMENFEAFGFNIFCIFAICSISYAMGIFGISENPLYPPFKKNWSHVSLGLFVWQLFIGLKVWTWRVYMCISHSCNNVLTIFRQDLYDIYLFFGTLMNYGLSRILHIETWTFVPWLSASLFSRYHKILPCLKLW